MIKLMLELIKLFGEKKIEKLNIYNDDIYIALQHSCETSCGGRARCTSVSGAESCWRTKR